jgi:hypothetical protein
MRSSLTVIFASRLGAQAHHPALRFLVAFFAGVFSDLAAAVIFSPDFRLAQRVHQVSGNYSDDFAINSFG